MTERGVWAYAVTQEPSVAGQLVGVTGVATEPVRTVEAGGLVAVVGAVDLTDFGEEALRRNLEDLTWLEATARRHHAVIDAVARSGAVAPLRLATVYRDDQRVAAMLAERRADFTAALSRVRGRTEWGVKIFARSGAGPGAEPGEDSTGGGSGEGGGTGRPGTAYLLRRKARLSAQREAQRETVNQAEEVHAVLTGLVEAAHRHPPQNPQLSGERAQMVLNAAYLVDAARDDAFATAVSDLGGRHPDLRVDLTGPWPPYSFADAGGERP
jgi:hypothetical protein